MHKIRIDQRELQKIDPLNPSAVIIRKLLSYVYKDVRRKLRIIDVSYGEGRFYKKSSSLIEFLVGIDIKKLKWVVCPSVFIQDDFRNVIDNVLSKYQFDILVVDFPFTRYKESLCERKHYKETYNYIKLTYIALRKAKEYGVPYMLVHSKHSLDTIYNLLKLEIIAQVEFFFVFRDKSRKKFYCGKSYYTLLRNVCNKK